VSGFVKTVALRSRHKRGVAAPWATAEARAPVVNIFTEEPTMPEKKVTCDCGKTMRAPNDEELVTIVQKHAKDVHNMTLTREQVLAMAEPA
jgi:predicted small metal-binding protein